MPSSGSLRGSSVEEFGVMVRSVPLVAWERGQNLRVRSAVRPVAVERGSAACGPRSRRFRADRRSRSRRNRGRTAESGSRGRPGRVPRGSRAAERTARRVPVSRSASVASTARRRAIPGAACRFGGTHSWRNLPRGSAPPATATPAGSESPRPTSHCFQSRRNASCVTSIARSESIQRAYASAHTSRLC